MPRRTPHVLFAIIAGAAIAGCGDDVGTLPVYQPAARLLVFSDPHYYAPALGTTGPAFASAVARDRKLIAESDAVVRALIGLIATEDPAFVLVPGDLTKDGERQSHEEMAVYLHQIEAQGRQVLVVPGNHDIQNGGAASYAGDTVTPVDTISAAEFAALYQDFGYRDALARDPASLSYLAELVPGLWLLAVDSCIYGDTRGSSATSGRLTAATKEWVKAQLDVARRHGVRVLAMMHHGLVEHFGSQGLIFPEYLVTERDAVHALLSDTGVGAVFTGHFHAQDITKGTPAGGSRSIYDIETGSAVTYPCPYRIVDVASDILTITTKHITTIDYDLGAASDFPTYARASLRAGLDNLISELIQGPPYDMPPEQAASLAPWLGDGLLGHYAGDEVMPAPALAESQALVAAPTPVEQLTGIMLQSIWTDLPPADNTITVDLAAR